MARLLLIAALGFLWGCGTSVLDDTPVVARYKDSELTQKQLEYHLPLGLSPKDSARYANNYINQWLKEQVIAEAAMKDNPQLEEEIEFKVRDYRSKLLVHAFRTNLIENSTDTLITEAEIQEYYNANKQKFISEEGLVSYFYLAVANTQNSSQIKSWMRSDSRTDINSLQEWAEQGNALEIKLDSTFRNESELDRLSKGFFVNLKNAKPGQLISWNGVIKGQRRKYFFKKLDVVSAGEPLPLSMTRAQIRQFLLKERLNKNIERREKELVDDALSSKKIKYNN